MNQNGILPRVLPWGTVMLFGNEDGWDATLWDVWHAYSEILAMKNGAKGDAGPEAAMVSHGTFAVDLDRQC